MEGGGKGGGVRGTHYTIHTLAHGVEREWSRATALSQQRLSGTGGRRQGIIWDGDNGGPQGWVFSLPTNNEPHWEP